MGVHTGQDEQALGSPEKEDTIMMKRFIRRMTAFALSAMLLTAPDGAGSGADDARRRMAVG